MEPLKVNLNDKGSMFLGATITNGADRVRAVIAETSPGLHDAVVESIVGCAMSAATMQSALAALGPLQIFPAAAEALVDTFKALMTNNAVTVKNVARAVGADLHAAMNATRAAGVVAFALEGEVNQQVTAQIAAEEAAQREAKAAVQH